jgi:hypothetical protein
MPSLDDMAMMPAKTPSGGSRGRNRAAAQASIGWFNPRKIRIGGFGSPTGTTEEMSTP